MKKFIKSQTALQIVACTVIATFVIAGVVSATTIGTNITTAGTLEVTSASTLTGAVTTGGALTVTGATTLNGAATLGDAAADIITITGTIAGASPLVLEGTTANDYETTIAVTDPTADRIITLPNGTGTVYITGGTDVAVADGGTGLSSYTAGDLIYASAATTLASLASSTDADLLMIDANGWPAWKTMSSDATISAAGALTIASNAVAGTDIQLASEAAGDIMYSNGTDWVRLASSTDANLMMIDANGWPAWKTMSSDATISDAGALTIASNAVAGTDIQLASETAGDIMYSNGTDWVRLAKGTALQVLRTNAGATAPEWATMVAALDNASAWTANQQFDEGLDVDDTAFVVSGAGALTTTQLATLNGGIAVDTNNFTIDGTTGALLLTSSATTGNLAAITLDAAAVTGATVGLNIDLSPITSGDFAKTGIAITGDDSGTATSIGISMAGTVDYGIDLTSATINTADIRLEADETISNSAEGTITFGRNDSGTVTLTAADDADAAALTITSGGVAAMTLDAGGAAALQLGTTNANAVTISKDTVMTTVEGTLNVDEAVTLDSTLGVSGALTMSAANEINLRDTALKIYSSVDGQLDIDADTEVEITATTVDLNGILDVSGALTITEGALTDSMVVSADIKNGEITTSDLSASAGITAAQLATAAKTNTMAVRIADISTAETLYVMMPKCTVTKISTVLSGAIGTANATITAYQNTTAITDGVVTIAYSGSAAGDIDSATPTANNTFDGSAQYLKLVGGGESDNVVPVIVTIQYTMTD